MGTSHLPANAHLNGKAKNVPIVLINASRRVSMVVNVLRAKQITFVIAQQNGLVQRVQNQIIVILIRV